MLEHLSFSAEGKKLSSAAACYILTPKPDIDWLTASGGGDGTEQTAIPTALHHSQVLDWCQ
jgi:hypothetical protein